MEEREEAVHGARCREKREFKDINRVHYYRESKENEKQGEVIWTIKRSLVKADLNGFSRVLGIEVRLQEVKESRGG